MSSSEDFVEFWVSTLFPPLAFYRKYHQTSGRFYISIFLTLFLMGYIATFWYYLLEKRDAMQVLLNVAAPPIGIYWAR